MQQVYKPYLKHPIIFVFIIGFLLGILFFVLFFGVNVIVPTNVDWLKVNNGDITQHYIGWIYFRQDAWSFPLGTIHSLAYPYAISVTFTDSIPLLAIPFKAASKLLPAEFQYFGMWGVVSYGLIGGIGGVIFMKLTKRIAVSIIGALFLIINPIVLNRMFSHTALAGQWVLLLGILAMLFSHTFSLKRFIVVWSLLLAGSIAVHPYFAMMNLFLFVVSLILSYSNINRLLIKSVVPLAVMLGVFWVIGGLIVSDGAAGGLDGYGINANGLVNSMGWSRILPTLPSHPAGYEGMAYLGLGILVLGAFLLYMLLRYYNRQFLHALSVYVKQPKIYASLIVLLLLVLLSSGSAVHIGAHTFHIPLPEAVKNVWSTFRAAGRLFWPVYYLIVIGIIVFTYQILKKRKQVVIIAVLLVAFVVQGIDIVSSPAAVSKRELFTQTTSTQYTMDGSYSRWKAMYGNRKHIQFLESVTDKEFYPIALLGYDTQMTLSDGYFARAPQRAIAGYRQRVTSELLKGMLRSDTVYFTKNEILFESIQEKVSVSSTKIYGYIIFATTQ